MIATAEENVSEFHGPIPLLGRFEPDVAGERRALGHDPRGAGDRVREVEIVTGLTKASRPGVPPMAASGLTAAATSLVAIAVERGEMRMFRIELLRGVR